MSTDLQQRSDQSRNESDNQATSRVRHRGATSISVTTGGGAIVGGRGGGRRVAGGGAVEGLGEVLERGEVALAGLVAIDCEHHPRTAVVGLATVGPDGSGVVDGKGPSGEIGGTCSNWEEAGVEPDPGVSGRVHHG